MASGGNVIDTDSEDEMPAGWEERVTLDGQVYYANHNSKETQWRHPTTGKKKKVAGELPYGWERRVDSEQCVYYIDHINRKTTYTDPRLAFAVEDKDSLDNGKNRFDGCSTTQQILLGRDLSNQYAIITGANSGIGYETAASLARHGAHVVLACRSIKKGQEAASKILSANSYARIEVMACDLTSFQSIRHFSEKYKLQKWPLHILILNAGVFCLPYSKTVDGFEATFQTNYLGHFYLTSLFRQILIDSQPSRVVVLAAESHRFTDLNEELIRPEILSPPASHYRPIISYNQSKMCCILFAAELNRQLWTKGVTCNSLHPGNLLPTNLPRHWWYYRLIHSLVRPFSKSLQQGAACTVFCATAREMAGIGGGYYNNCFRCQPSEECLKEKTRRKLWEVSESMLALTV